jgi:epoxyqueuosine reductase
VDSAARQPEPVAIGADVLAERLRELCPPQRIDLAGAVALPCPLPHADHWHGWLAAACHAGLAYLERDPETRVDPIRRHPWARSLLVFAQRYADGWDRDDRSPWTGAAADRPWTDGVARYARGRDYHSVLLRAIRRLVKRLRATWPDLVARVAVDTGPYLEREYAWLAGLGFLGKNACLIHERLGSGLLLGVALTNLEVAGLAPAGRPAAEPLYGVVPRTRARPGEHAARRDARHADARRGDGAPGGPPATPPDGPLTRCGRCTRCLEACPTGAIVEPHRVDARRCIATWTIEWRGGTPADRRGEQGALLFGCDICQAVCPWNRRAARNAADRPPGGEAAVVAQGVATQGVKDVNSATATGTPDLDTDIWPVLEVYGTRQDYAAIALADLATVATERFRELFRSSPIWRCHPAGLRRNALVVAANTGRIELVETIRRCARADPDPDVRAVAVWALARLAERRRAEP